MIEPEQAAHRDRHSRFLGRLAHRRRDQILAELDLSRGQVEGAVPLFHDQVAAAIGDDGEDEEMGGERAHALIVGTFHGAFYAFYTLEWCTMCTMNDLLLHLESFVVLGDRIAAGGPGAFDGAAHELRIDRSVLRRRIQALTAHVGAPLLRGRGSALTPTDAGARLHARARAIVAETRDLARLVREARERIVVACTGTITTELLPRVLRDLDGDPDARIDLVVRRAGGALAERMLLAGEADVAVVRSERAPTAFAAQLLAEDRLWLAVPKKHPLATGPLEPARLASAPLVLYGASSRTRARVMERLAPRGAFVRVEVDGKGAALEYVRAGLGITFVSLLVGHEPPSAGLVLRDVTPHFARSRFWAMCRPERRGDAAIDRVLKLLDRHAHARPRGAR